MGFSTYLTYATSPSTIHILSYGILSGTTIWHSFIGGPLAYKCLPRQQFGHLQSKLFPPFFALQTLTAALCFVTSYRSVSASYNELIALGGIAVSGALNLVLVGPWTTTIMNQRHKLERATNTKYTDDNISDDMRTLNTRFAIAHSVSSIINLAAVGAIVAHAIHLGHKLNLIEPY